MEILSHRGYWKTAEEKNSHGAFVRAFEKGYGVETDVRDFQGHLVISHDIPNKGVMDFDSFLELYKSFPEAGTLALNIKADGLHALLSEALRKFEVSRYFVFDMSIPDTLQYLKDRNPVFYRISEYEGEGTLYEKCQGVWADIFESNWIDEKLVAKHLAQGKQVALVSPELHKRQDYQSYWQRFKNIDQSGLMLCTDFPEEADLFFRGEK